MTILKGNIIEEINQKFRKLAMERFGYEKGSISKAMEEAIVQWITNQKNVDTDLEKMRIKNNDVYKRMKMKLLQEYPNKYITICDGKIAEIGDDYFSTVEKTKTSNPNVVHCLVINTKVSRRRKARLGWRTKRIAME